MRKKDQNDIKREFRLRQTRQIIAMAVALFLVMLAAVLYKRPDLVGALSKGTLFGLQAISIAAFLGYTAYNWRCPSCDKHLGGNVHRQRCSKCGATLQ
jgi:hypothetical protein